MKDDVGWAVPTSDQVVPAVGTAHPTRHDRRQWIGGALRGAALVGLTLLAGGLLAKRYLVGAKGDCRVGLPCRQCPASAQCRYSSGLRQD